MYYSTTLFAFWLYRFYWAIDRTWNWPTACTRENTSIVGLVNWCEQASVGSFDEHTIITGLLSNAGMSVQTRVQMYRITILDNSSYSIWCNYATC